jgi:hypothetical protein
VAWMKTVVRSASVVDGVHGWPWPLPGRGGGVDPRPVRAGCPGESGRWRSQEARQENQPREFHGQGLRRPGLAGLPLLRFARGRVLVVWPGGKPRFGPPPGGGGPASEPGHPGGQDGREAHPTAVHRGVQGASGQAAAGGRARGGCGLAPSELGGLVARPKMDHGQNGPWPWPRAPSPLCQNESFLALSAAYAMRPRSRNWLKPLRGRL